MRPGYRCMIHTKYTELFCEVTRQYLVEDSIFYRVHDSHEAGVHAYG